MGPAKRMSPHYLLLPSPPFPTYISLNNLPFPLHRPASASTNGRPPTRPPTSPNQTPSSPNAGWTPTTRTPPSQTTAAMPCSPSAPGHATVSDRSTCPFPTPSPLPTSLSTQGFFASTPHPPQPNPTQSIPTSPSSLPFQAKHTLTQTPLPLSHGKQSSIHGNAPDPRTRALPLRPRARPQPARGAGVDRRAEDAGTVGKGPTHGDGDGEGEGMKRGWRSKRGQVGYCGKGWGVAGVDDPGGGV